MNDRVLWAEEAAVTAPAKPASQPPGEAVAATEVAAPAKKGTRTLFEHFSVRRRFSLF